MFNQVEAVLRNAVGALSPAIQLVVRWQGEIAWAFTGGWLDPETQQYATQPDTLFDLASLTKLFTTTTFMTLVDAGQVTLDQPVHTILTELNETRPIHAYEAPLSPGEFVTVTETAQQVDARQVTFRHLLAHTSGLPAWRPLYKQPNAEAAHQMALHTFFSYLPGTQVVYSDLGLILTGIAIERLTGQTLDEAIREQVLEPLGLQHTGYLKTSLFSSSHIEENKGKEREADTPCFPQHTREKGNIAPTELCQWRGRRIVGEVHDENAWQLGGVSGHAGLFSTASDIATFGQIFLDRNATFRGRQLLNSETVDEMTRLQAQSKMSRRGLGFGLWSPDPEASGHPFSQQAFGHTGFTGTSLWIDPARELVVALMTNEVYNGRKNRKTLALRINTHKAIVEAIDKKQTQEIET